MDRDDLSINASGEVCGVQKPAVLSISEAERSNQFDPSVAFDILFGTQMIIQLPKRQLVVVNF